MVEAENEALWDAMRREWRESQKLSIEEDQLSDRELAVVEALKQAQKDIQWVRDQNPKPYRSGGGRSMLARIHDVHEAAERAKRLGTNR